MIIKSEKIKSKNHLKGGLIKIDQKVKLSKIKSDLFFATLIAGFLSFIIILIFYIGNLYWESFFFIIIGIALELLIFLIFILRRQRQLKKQKISLIESINKKIPIKMSDEIGFNENCKICKINLEPNQEIIRCPKCESIFHKEHLQNWLKVEFFCPICKYDYNELFIEEIVDE